VTGEVARRDEAFHMVIDKSPFVGASGLLRAWGRRWLATAAVGLLTAPPAWAASPLPNRPTVDREVLRAGSPDGKTSETSEARPGSSDTRDTPRIASVASRPSTAVVSSADRHPGASVGLDAPGSDSDPIVLAKKAIRECQERYRQIQDYTCTFVKVERIDGRLTPKHIMAMKARTQPNSLYFKFQQPNRGREAIYVQGKNQGRIVAHDVGLGKLFAGTLHLDPRGTMAMEENRHPVTEAGIGSLIETVAKHWAVELTPGESRVTFHPDSRIGNHPCTMIESVHPVRGPNFLFHKVRLYIDQEHGLPIRLESYDWPKHPGAAPELVEEYSYLDLKVNNGLRDHDFDPSNKQYSFGRF
jgi:hypothetical protein